MSDEARVFYDDPRFTREVLIEMLIETNHHLDLMVECYGIESLVELVESEEE
jgi:hypothetical protein